MSVSPITPAEAKAKVALGVPDEVYEAFNELIVRNLKLHTSMILQSEVEKLIRLKLGDRLDLDPNWLAIEPAYRAVGWHVDYRLFATSGQYTFRSIGL